MKLAFRQENATRFQGKEIAKLFLVVLGMFFLYSRHSRNQWTDGFDQFSLLEKAPLPTKIWSEMSPVQRDEALESVLPYVKSLSDTLNKQPIDRWKDQGHCEVLNVGDQTYGTHAICQFQVKPDEECSFLSFGIENAYSFDAHLADDWGCHGYAADPTVVHPSELHPGVTFHNVAATLLTPNNQQQQSKKKWWTASMPSTKRYLQIEHLNVLKFDCEGCEYALSRDILIEDPEFLHRVDQVTGEFHVSNTWLNSPETLYYFGMLLKLLDEAGFRLQTSRISGCNDRNQNGCMKELAEMSYPGACQVGGASGARACHEYLFSKH